MVAKKATKSKASKSEVKQDQYNPHTSPVIQTAVVFIFIAAIVLVAYAAKFYL